MESKEEFLPGLIRAEVVTISSQLWDILLTGRTREQAAWGIVTSQDRMRQEESELQLGVLRHQGRQTVQASEISALG